MFQDLIEKIATALNKNSIPYMIIGGQALLLYGEPRLTKDIDITLAIGIDKLQKIVDIINEINLTIIPKNLEEFVKNTYVLPTKDEKTHIRVDFIFSYTPYEKQAIDRAKKIKIKNVMVNFASIEDLIIHKIFAGRPRDIEDIKSVMIKNKNFDKKYIIKWLKEFDKSGNELIKKFNEALKIREEKC